MSKYIFCFGMLLPLLLNSCKHETSTTTNVNNHDSIYLPNYITHICIKEPQHALALTDTAEMRNLLRTNNTCLDAMKGLIYNNGLNQRKLSKFYCLKAYEDPEFKKNTANYLNNLAMIANHCYKSSDYAATLRYAMEGLEMARKNGLKDLEANFLMHIGLSQAHIGTTKEGYANLQRSISLYKEVVEKDGNWGNVNKLIYTLGETMNAQCTLGDWQEAATLIPQLESATALLEAHESQAPTGVVDHYKAFVYAQCLEVCQQMGDRFKASEYYRKCIATEYAHSPIGLPLLTPHLLWTKDYRQLLENIHIAKQAYQNGRSTESEFYVDELLDTEVKALTGLGNYKEAVEVSSEIIGLKDKIYQRKQEDEVQELAVIYETGQKEMQLKEQALTIRNQWIYLIGGGVLLLLIIVLVVRTLRYNRTLSRKNQAAANTISDLLKYKKELESLKENKETPLPAPEGTPESTIPNTDHDKLLFERLKQKIMDGNGFLDSDTTKKGLLEQEHLSENKFTQLFNKYTDGSYKNFIINTKLEYSAQLLKENAAFSIDAIAKECDFSRSSFYRLFTAKYGITPSEFRKQLDEGLH